ncbi:hypothetical protein GJ496_007241 [Pomphorhynchus laevis]|nr:hypothetical protein GJ496_007241 [Pomphorhynchus laevis]
MIIAVSCAVLLIICISVALSLLKYHPSSLQLQGKHVLITGASSGIGFELSKLCAARGANVTMVARNKERLVSAESVVSRGCQHSNKVMSISCDVSSSYDAIEDMVDKSVKSNGPIDILICNAGICFPVECAQAQPSQIKESINVNLMGPCLLCKASLSKMSKPARIVLLSSQAGQIGLYGYSSYSPAKFGLLGLAQCLQMELLKRDVHVTVAFPPDTNTPGYTEELKQASKITQNISQRSGTMEPHNVARKILDAAQNGKFACTFGINGLFLHIATSGASPIYSYWEVIVQTLLAIPAKLSMCIANRSFYHLVDTAKDH